MSSYHNRKFEMLLAAASFLMACVLALVSILISEEHDIAAGVCMVIAQFLLLTGSIIGIDYKLGSVPVITKKQTSVNG